MDLERVSSVVLRLLSGNSVTLLVKPFLLCPKYFVRDFKAFSRFAFRVDPSTPKEVAAAATAKLGTKYPSNPPLDTLKTPELMVPLTPNNVSSKPDQEWHVKISITVSSV